MSRLQNLINQLYAEFDCNLQSCQPSCQDCQQDCNACLRNQYFSGGRRPRYDCSNVKNVYINKFLAARVHTARIAINHALEVLPKRTKNLAFTCFGTGPGTDAIALMDILADNPLPANVSFFGCDLDHTWQPFAEKLVAMFQNHGGLPVPFKFIKLDATQPYNGGGDIVLASWILSEIEARSTQSIQTRARLDMLKRATDCAQKAIIVMDRTEQAITELVDNFFASTPSVAQPVICRSVSGNHGVNFPDGKVRKRVIPACNYEMTYWIALKV